MKMSARHFGKLDSSETGEKRRISEASEVEITEIWSEG